MISDEQNTETETNWRNALETLITEYTAAAHDVMEEYSDFSRGQALVYQEIAHDLQQMLDQEITT